MEGNPKVIDFGVARTLGFNPSDGGSDGRDALDADPASGLERPGHKSAERWRDSSNSAPPGSSDSPPMVGTLSYMSPEQGDQSMTVDARTDVYSLGVILFELLCDSLPYDLRGVSIPAALTIIGNQPPRPASRRGRPLPDDLAAILARQLKRIAKVAIPRWRP